MFFAELFLWQKSIRLVKLIKEFHSTLYRSSRCVQLWVWAELCCHANFTLIDTYLTIYELRQETVQERWEGETYKFYRHLFFFSDVNFFALIPSLCAWVEQRRGFRNQLIDECYRHQGVKVPLKFEDKEKLEQTMENRKGNSDDFSQNYFGWKNNNARNLTFYFALQLPHTILLMVSSYCHPLFMFLHFQLIFTLSDSF